MFEFTKRIPLGKKLSCRLERINVCYTLIEDKEQRNRHSEAIVLDRA